MASSEVTTPGQESGIFGIWRAWERFWFTPGDPTTLGLMRLLGGFLIFYVHLSYSFDLQTFFGKEAWLNLDLANELRHELPMFSPGTQWDRAADLLPRNAEEQKFYEQWGYRPTQSIDKGRDIFSLWYHLTDPVQMRIAHSVILACMFLFAIGFCSRITGVLTWIFLLFYINRSNVSVFGMDTMMNILAMYLVIGPSGAAFSVDRLIERRIASRRRGPGAVLEPAAPSVSANIAIRLVQINFCFVYGMSGLSKLQGGSWWSGTATWLTMVNYEFSPMSNSLYMGILRYVSGRRWLWELIMFSSTLMTLTLELTLPLLIWNRKLRWIYICGSSLFHLSIAMFMSLVGFSITMLVLLLSFVPGWAIRDVFSRLKVIVPAASKAELANIPHATARVHALSSAE
jgi:hypothetical protein